MSDFLARTNRFDRAVWLFIAVLLITIGLLIRRGDQIGMQVVALTPPPQAQDVSPLAQIEIRFDQALADADTPVTLILDPPVDGTVEQRVDRLVFTPATSLAPNQTYTVTLDAELWGAKGRRLLAPVRWHFQTTQTRILFTAMDGENREQLFTMPLNLDEPAMVEPAQLSDAPFGIWDYGISPDARTVVYSALTEEGTSDLWQIARGGEATSTLLRCEAAACTNPAWSPDGSLLAFSARNATGFSATMVNPPRLWLMDPVTNETLQVFPDEQALGFEPRWSANGAWLSYVAPDLGGVGVYNLNNGRTYFYATSTGEPGIWHPGRPLLLITDMQQTGNQATTHIWAVDVVTEERTDLSLHPYPVEDNAPAWSPDGEWIAFRRKELDGPSATLSKQLWLMRADGSQATALTADPNVDHGQPLWSPDGRFLLFHKLPLRGPEIVISVWLMELETGRVWELASPGQRPMWLP